MNSRTTNARLGWDQVVVAIVTTLVTLVMIVTLSLVSGHNVWVVVITAPFIWAACHFVGLHVIAVRRGRLQVLALDGACCKCVCHQAISNGATIEYGPSA